VICLLDTNACIALINGRPEAVRRRFERASSGGAAIATSSVAVSELWYGVGTSQRREANARRLTTFLSGPLELLEFDDEDARAAGEVRSTLELSGKPIGAYDVLIAGQSLRRGATLVTANASGFTRVSGLRWEDWAGSW
jgi:tRNA(fMet)-specific endonuclease VapC